MFILKLLIVLSTILVLNESQTKKIRISENKDINTIILFEEIMQKYRGPSANNPYRAPLIKKTTNLKNYKTYYLNKDNITSDKDLKELYNKAEENFVIKKISSNEDINFSQVSDFDAIYKIKGFLLEFKGKGKAHILEKKLNESITKLKERNRDNKNFLEDLVLSRIAYQLRNKNEIHVKELINDSYDFPEIQNKFNGKGNTELSKEEVSDSLGLEFEVQENYLSKNPEVNDEVDIVEGADAESEYKADDREPREEVIEGDLSDKDRFEIESFTTNDLNDSSDPAALKKSQTLIDKTSVTKNSPKDNETSIPKGKEPENSSTKNNLNIEKKKEVVEKEVVEKEEIKSPNLHKQENIPLNQFNQSFSGGKLSHNPNNQYLNNLEDIDKDKNERENIGQNLAVDPNLDLGTPIAPIPQTNLSKSTLSEINSPIIPVIPRPENSENSLLKAKIDTEVKNENGDENIPVSNNTGISGEKEEDSPSDDKSDKGLTSIDKEDFILNQQNISPKQTEKKDSQKNILEKSGNRKNEKEQSEDKLIIDLKPDLNTPIKLKTPTKLSNTPGSTTISPRTSSRSGNGKSGEKEMPLNTEINPILNRPEILRTQNKKPGNSGNKNLVKDSQKKPSEVNLDDRDIDQDLEEEKKKEEEKKEKPQVFPRNNPNSENRSSNIFEKEINNERKNKRSKSAKNISLSNNDLLKGINKQKIRPSGEEPDKNSSYKPKVVSKKSSKKPEIDLKGTIEDRNIKPNGASEVDVGGNTNNSKSDEQEKNEKGNGWELWHILLISCGSVFILVILGYYVIGKKTEYEN